MGLDRRQRHAHLSVTGIRPMLDCVVVGVRSRKLIAVGLDDRVRAFELKLRRADLEGKCEIEFQTRCRVLQDPIGQVDPLDVVVERYFLRDLGAAGAGR